MDFSAAAVRSSGVLEVGTIVDARPLAPAVEMDDVLAVDDMPVPTEEDV